MEVRNVLERIRLLIRVSVNGCAEYFLCARQLYLWNFSQENERRVVRNLSGSRIAIIL
jgi:hypothetical protein